MLTGEQLQRAASDTGFPIDSLEKVSMQVRLLNLMAAHPYLGPVPMNAPSLANDGTLTGVNPEPSVDR